MTVFADRFYQIRKSEIFKKSQCLEHETAVAKLFSSILTNLGYVKQRSDTATWKSGQKTVIVCLVDDFTIFKTDHSQLVGQCFDSNTVIITDNRVRVHTQYKVLKLPDSYIGTFNYVPDKLLLDPAKKFKSTAPGFEKLTFNPVKRFSFSVNRLDQQRQLILLELIKQSGGVNNWLSVDHINFNCYDPRGINETTEDLVNNFLKYWNNLSADYTTHVQTVEQLLAHLPIRTHQLTIEQAHLSAYVTLVIETYGGDSVITFSEKTFRALLTPAPWTLFGCFGAVEWLSQQGFDVLADIVDHSYNNVTQDDSFNGIEKIRAYINSSIKIYKKLASMEVDQLNYRCEQAAQHNQKRLLELQKQWPQDFANWLPQAIAKLQ